MKHRLLILVTSLAFFISMFAGILPQSKPAGAAGTYTYSNSTYVAIQGPNPSHASGDPSDVTYQKTGAIGKGVYLAKNAQFAGSSGGFCVPAIQTNNHQYSGDTKAVYYVHCGSFDTYIEPRNPTPITIGTGIVGDANPTQRKVFDEELCPSLKDLDRPLWTANCRQSYAYQKDLDKAANKICTKYPDELKAQCDDYKNKTSNPDNVSSGSDASLDCESGSFSFNWVLCPIFDGVNSTTNWVFTNLIQPLLMTNPICLDPSGTGCDNTVYRIWSGFRIYGDIFLVIVLLVIVFGESIGGGLIDAYTAKKVLPRLLIAAILINLSIYIVALLIDITNVVGGGLGQLLTAPLQGNGAFTIQPDGITQGKIAAFGATGLLIGGFALGVTGIALLMVGLIITGAIAMLGIFITLILRQTIILALLLISPVAFSLWCLPNTQSWFKRWWDTLFQMLLVYPMIIVLFAVADVMSYVTQHNGQGGTLGSIVAFMLLIIPLYLVPFTLRSSNRLMGAIHGAVSNIGRQVNAATGRRAFAGAGQAAGQNFKRMQENQRFNPNSRYLGGVNKRLNSFLSNVTSPEAAAKIHGGSLLRKAGISNSMGEGILNQIDQTKLDHSQKLGEKLNKDGFNDRALRALMDMDEYSAPAIKAKAAEMAQSNDVNDQIGARLLANNASYLAQNLYKDEEMGRADIGMSAGLAVAAQGFSNTDEIAELANKRINKGEASAGLASSFVTNAQLAGQRAGMLDAKPGYGIVTTKDGFMGTGDSAIEHMGAEQKSQAIVHQIRRLVTTGSSEFQGAKGGSVKEMGSGLKAMFKAASGPVNAKGNYEVPYVDDSGNAQTYEISPQQVKRVATMVGAAQASHTNTAAGTVQAYQEIMGSAGLTGEALKAYTEASRGYVDPSLLGGEETPDSGGDGK
jgi:hypothetical protein